MMFYHAPSSGIVSPFWVSDFKKIVTKVFVATTVPLVLTVLLQRYFFMDRAYPSPLTVSKTLARGLDDLLEKRIEGEDAREKLGELLQAALHLEFSTIAPYLSAAYSITEDNAIRRLILRVAKEEMLHMTAVANLMNAIGIPPRILEVISEYPFDLVVIDGTLLLELKSFSFELVENLFMKIEAPEDPVEFPTLPSFGGLAFERPKTIGEFYAGIIELIGNDTIPDLFVNAERDVYKQRQVALRFDQERDKINYLSDQENGIYPLKADINFLIRDKESAVHHLEWIVSEGEGAEKFNPLGPEGIPGHYYRFESILESRYLIRDENVELKYSYSGGGLPFSPDEVHEFDPNAKVEHYAASPQVERHMKRFNEKYTAMIDGLQAAFNCPSPEQEPVATAAYDEAISAMRDMPGIAGAIIRKAKEANIKAGLPFQYKPVDPPLA
ncbi:MAG: ferritin-like domain-containing protein [Verrucomicrobiales bacterium]